MMNVLFVGNNPDLAVCLCGMLASDGHQSIHIAKAADAVALAPSLSPDLGLVDIDMPYGEGLETIARLRQKVAGLEVMAIGLAPQGQHRRRVAAACGASVVISGHGIDALVLAIRKYLAADG